MWYIVLGILAISIIVIVHEGGHFLFAKLFKMPVEVFCLGYGKPLIKKKWGGTVYGIGPVPFGGYVKIPGLDPREVELMPEDERESFVIQPFWKRALMVVGGPAANILFAIILFIVIFMIGVPGATTTIKSIVKDSPAAKAGLKAGDKVIGVDDVKITKWEDFVTYVRATEYDTVVVTVRRGDKSLDLTSGVKIENGTRVIGVVAKETDYNIGMGFTEAAPSAASWVWTLVSETFSGIWQLVTGRIEFRPMSPVGIVQVTSQAARHGAIMFLNFIAFISVAIGITNLIPIYPLDGARVVLWGAERIRGKRLADWAVLIFQYGGVVLLLAVTVWAVYLDIFQAIPDPFK